ncbi:Rv2629 family ribosome hibernation factor [Mycolicibacterium brisbanense]|uniref:Peptide chain release factor 1 n=1 Tax=Mycolicibacterium brisbanense TaxID=146020 RepID=A0A100W0M1_9MYCO|nr:Vms1/Ankzf1 family peptidyl-tRNA hydrolase [Mycolicibacterium brisbanense]MCV7155952.1 hypothetical protein [Mycolicibacterium brisbanense]GAS89455.1 uncharacterized protein RMCB_3551 [Mycolicibacterium brisbanense]
MNTEEFRRLVDIPGPFVSAYLDDSRSDAAKRPNVEWRSLSSKLEHMGADPSALDHMEHAILHSRPAVGRQGRAVVVTRERVLINEHVSRPPAAPVLRVSDYPFLVPLVEFGYAHPPYVFVAVDRSGAEITVHSDGDLRTEVVEGEGYPVHKAATSGFSGYVDFRSTTDEAIRVNVRAVAERITEIVDQMSPDVVFVSGEVRSRNDVISELPPRVAQKVSQLHAGSRGQRANETELGELVKGVLQRLGCVEIAETVRKYLAEMESKSGMAVEGISAVCTALRARNVAALIIGLVGDATVVTGADRAVVAPDADTLSLMGEPVSRVARADEALPFAAIAVDAALVAVDDSLTLTDGIGALLRFSAGDGM